VNYVFILFYVILIKLVLIKLLSKKLGGALASTKRQCLFSLEF